MDLEKRIAKLSPQQRKRLESKLKQQDIDILKLPITKVEPTGDRQGFPLSFEQERLWFIHRLYPGNSAYNIIRATKFEGNLNKRVLEQGIAELVRRHDILRTIFITGDEGPAQVILKELLVPLEIIDLKDFPVEQQSGEINRIIDNEARYIFDLEKGPLLRTRLLVLNKREDEHIFLLTIHHIVSDGTSIQVIVVELGQLYRAFLQGRDPGFAGLPIRYVDYACWQRLWFGEMGNTLGFMKKQETYWLEQFQGEIPVLTLPTDYARPEFQSFEGRTASFHVSGEETGALKEMAKKMKTTLYVVLLAIYNIFLAKLSGMEDVIVGTPVAGRRHPGVRGLVGMFVNTLALRNYPVHEQTFRKFLEVVKNRTLEAFENQEYQYESLLGKLSPTRDLGRNPLFDVFFEIDVPFVEMNIEGLKWKVFEYENRASQFDMTLTSCEVDAGGIKTLRFDWQYCTKLFKEDTIDRFTGYFKEVVKAVLNDFETRIAEIEIIPPGEKEKILFEFNDTTAAYPENKTIHGLFEEQVEQTPDVIAVVGQPVRPVSLTYRQLNEQSDRLAGLLIEKGVQPDTIVGIMVERSIEMIVGIFGILKSGGIYLPIDPEYPQERIDYMLKDSAAKILIKKSEAPISKFETNSSEKNPNDQNKKPHFGDVRVLNFEHLNFGIVSDFGFRISDFNPLNLAYLIYTSGTTGKPKGAVIEHHSLVNRLNWMQKTYPLYKRDTILQKTTFTFDVSVWEIFWWSMVGARLCLLLPGGEKDPELIAQAIERNHITIIHFVPSMLRVFLDYLKESGQAKKVSALKQVIASGEALLPVHVERFNELLNKSNGAVLSNLYGPTEAAIDVSYFDCLQKSEREVIPIGKPIDNICLYILDRNYHHQPIGVVGELYIAGAGLARGYLNRPALTDEKFNRFNKSYRSNKTYILYKTGDLARWLNDGNIEFLGRIDHQVKIRGFRIEPGEIENRLSKHPGIKEAVVLDLTEENGDKYLCAYIVSINEKVVSGLREYLSKELPGYMIPSYFVRLEKIPLTPNGKIDRKALPKPVLNISEKYIAPRDEIEKKLVGLWAEILGRDALHSSQLHTSIGINDNFFEMGGHSLKATILITKIHNAFHVNIPMAEIFKTATVRGLANYINASIKEEYVSIAPVEKKEYYALSSAQKRLYILFLMGLQGIEYNIPFFSLLEGEIDKDRLVHTFRLLIARHESLRTSFHLINDGPVQKIHDEVEFEIDKSFAELFQKRLPEGPPEAIIKSFIRSFDLSKAPLLRVGLLKEKGDRHFLMVDMHHIISDGISMNIVVKDFMALYQGEDLPGLQVQYKDFSGWQGNEKQRESIKRQEDFWVNEFAGEIPVLELPADYSRPSVQTYEGGSIYFEINKEVPEALKRLTLETGTTLYMILLAIYSVFLAKLSGQEDIVVGSPTAGRRHGDLEKIIGMFVNTLALRTYPSGEKTFTGFLYEVKEKTLKAFENQDYQYENLVDKMAISRDVSRNPLFDAMFVLQNMDNTTIDIPGLKLTPYRYENVISKFDLTLSGLEEEGKLIFTFEYCTKLFREETVNRFIAYFKKIVNEVILVNDRRISDFEIITEGEKRKILLDFNDTEAEYPKDKTIHRLFEEQVEQTPDNIALHGCMGQNYKLQITNYKQSGVLRADVDAFGDEAVPGEDSAIPVQPVQQVRPVRSVQLTYRELNKRSSQLAGLLIEKGVQSDTIVGIMMGRSIEMIIGIMGILKSGGAYLPIDPDYPRERIEYMLKDSEAKLLVNEKFFRGSRGAVLQKIPLCSANLAYLIYTSGSTGKPKGVMIEHRAVHNFMEGIAGIIEFRPGKTILALTTITFDIFGLETLLPFCRGLKIVLAAENHQREMPLLEQLIIRNCVDMLQATPTRMQMFTMGGAAASCLKDLKEIMVGGEAFPVKLLEDLRRLSNARICKIYNMYGPTETTIWSSAAELTAAEKITIGLPIVNTQTYILDKYSKIQPVGFAGELYIGGDGLARGYLNNPELTAEKFIDFHHSLLYRTGDRARWLLDGNIEFLGRIDYQVKIRGFRIELGEIENRIMKYPGIKEALVTAKTTENDLQYLSAYIVSSREFQVLELKKYLQDHLPGYMIPERFSILEKFPLSPNGKIDRKALDSIKVGMKAGVEHAAPRSDVEKKIADTWKEVLKLDDVGIFDNFFELGGNSLNILTVNNKIKTAFEMDIPVAKMFTYPTIHSLANYIHQDEMNDALAGEKIDKSANMVEAAIKEFIRDEEAGLEVAVIGMAGRFPGAKNITEFWNNLKNGVESITFFSEEELEKEGVDPNLLKNPNFVKASGTLEGVEYFDAFFFGYTPREAEIMNPEMRFFHECAWEALEDAGYNSESYEGLIGVYAGASSYFSWEGIAFLSGKTREIGNFAASHLTCTDFLTTTISYKFNLKGPSSFIQTACSTSLAAIHYACSSLLLGECHMATAGGVGLNINQKQGYLYEEGMISSPDGHCRAFDAQANGTVAGNGIGIVVLKRLKNAVADGDNIYAVIKGSAINNDGSRKVGYTAPGVLGQAEVIRKAQAMAHVEPGSIGYIETHGTATPLGDPIEIEALTLVFHREKRNYCPIGSVKTNIGHLDAAAGVAGFIKTVLCLKNGQIPPSLHFKEPNPKIAFKNSPFYVNSRLTEWKSNDYPRRAGVSSFGIGGTNVHVVLEEWPLDNLKEEVGREFQLLLLSAKTQTALDKMTGNLAAFLNENRVNPALNLSNTAYTAMVGRKHFDYRRMIVYKDIDDAITALSSPGSRKVHTFFSKEQERPVIFMFPGLGSQYVNMGRELFETEPVFRDRMNHGFEILKSLIDDDIKEILYPDKESAALHEKIKNFEIAQPVIFIFEYSLAQLLLKWGITPTAMIGYSFGEYVAACLAGVFSLEEAL